MCSNPIVGLLSCILYILSQFENSLDKNIYKMTNIYHNYHSTGYFSYKAQHNTVCRVNLRSTTFLELSLSPCLCVCVVAVMLLDDSFYCICSVQVIA